MLRMSLMLVAGATVAFMQTGAAPAAPLTTELAAVQDTAGKGIFTGKGLCHVCHGADAKGTPLAPDLTDKEWLHIDGTEAAIARIVKAGVPAPKKHPAAMPPMGGAQLTDAEINAVAKYVFSLSPKS